MMTVWRLAWGKLGDSLAELSSVRELLEDRKDHKLSKDDHKTLLNELALVRRECDRIERIMQGLSGGTAR